MFSYSSDGLHCRVSPDSMCSGMVQDFLLLLRTSATARELQTEGVERSWVSLADRLKQGHENGAKVQHHQLACRANQFADGGQTASEEECRSDSTN